MLERLRDGVIYFYGHDPTKAATVAGGTQQQHSRKNGLIKQNKTPNTSSTSSTPSSSSSSHSKDLDTYAVNMIEEMLADVLGISCSKPPSEFRLLGWWGFFRSKSELAEID